MSATTPSGPITWHGFRTRSLPEVPGWIEPLGRAGYIAKGVVYGIIGFLAFQLAIGAGGEIAGAREAIREIGQQPFGRILLGLVAIGLFGYTAWRLVQAIKDTEGEGTDAKGVIKRIGYTISGLAYLTLAFFAASIAIGSGGGGGGGGQGQAGPLLDTMWGRVLLGIAGGITIGVAIAFVYKAIKAKFMEKYDLAAMDENKRKLALYVGRIGLSTRAVAFAIIGGFIIMSAIRGTGDGDIAGISDALAAIASQPYGKILIGITGLGLICFGIHQIMMGLYRRFNVAGANH